MVAPEVSRLRAAVASRSTGTLLATGRPSPAQAAGQPRQARAPGGGATPAQGRSRTPAPEGRDAPQDRRGQGAASDAERARPAPSPARPAAQSADPSAQPSIRRATVGWLAASLAVQVICALFFVVELVTDVLGLRHWALSWEIREALQVAASLGLILGAVLGVILLRQTLKRIRNVERQVAAASGAFFEVMDGCFAEWGLTPSEREVALFAVRGYSNSEIAETRGKSEATIKTQMNAVFRKAGVTGRAQLISQFVDVLIASGPGPEGAPLAAQPAR